MEKEILNAIVEMVRQGGQLAVWGVFVYLFMQILKVAVSGGIIWIIIRTICTTFLGGLELHIRKRSEEITLLSEEVSASLTNTLEQYSKSMTEVLESIERQMKNCSKDSGNTEKQ